MNDLESAFMILWRSIPRNVLQALLETFLDACDEESIKLDEEEIGDEKSDEETSDEGSIEIGDEKSDEETSDEESIEIGDEKSDEKIGDEKSDELFPEFSRAHAYIDNNKNISNLIKDIKNKKKENAKKKEKESETAVDIKRFFEFFNKTVEEAGSVMPTVTKSSKVRSRAIAARAREFGKEGLKTMVEKAAKSDFLNGKNDRSWVATIDWLLRPNNFPKVLDGNYDNRKINNYYGNDYRQQIYDRRRGWDAEDVDPEEYAKGYRHEI